MTTLHHRIKTHGRWQVQQPFRGIYLWRDPYGALFLVDHTGTRRILTRFTEPVAVELWHSRIKIDFGA